MTIAPLPLDASTRWPGMRTIHRHEARLWWRSRRWWIQTMLWTALLNGGLALFLWISRQAGGVRLDSPAVDVTEVFPQFIGFSLLLSTIGVVVLTQGAMLDERRDGILEWVLAKPLSRTGFVLAKLLAHTVPVLAVFVVAPWTGLYVQLSSHLGRGWPVADFLTVVGLVSLVLVFTVGLVLLLGTWTSSRALVIGVPIAAGFVYDSLHLLVPGAAGRLPLPWELPTIATMAAAGEPLPSMWPPLTTVVWIAGVVAATAWRFEREEFG